MGKKLPEGDASRGRMPERPDAAGDCDHWLAMGEQVTALFDCALRGAEDGNRTVAERSVLELMRCLHPEGPDAGGRVLAHFDSCLAQLERGEFEEAFEALADLRDSWIEALATMRKDRTRAANIN